LSRPALPNTWKPLTRICQAPAGRENGQGCLGREHCQCTVRGPSGRTNHCTNAQKDHAKSGALRANICCTQQHREPAGRVWRPASTHGRPALRASLDVGDRRRTISRVRKLRFLTMHFSLNQVLLGQGMWKDVPGTSCLQRAGASHSRLPRGLRCAGTNQPHPEQQKAPADRCLNTTPCCSDLIASTLPPTRRLRLP